MMNAPYPPMKPCAMVLVKGIIRIVTNAGAASVISVLYRDLRVRARDIPGIIGGGSSTSGLQDLGDCVSILYSAGKNNNCKARQVISNMPCMKMRIPAPNTKISGIFACTTIHLAVFEGCGARAGKNSGRRSLMTCEFFFLTSSRD